MSEFMHNGEEYPTEFTYTGTNGGDYPEGKDIFAQSSGPSRKIPVPQFTSQNQNKLKTGMGPVTDRIVNELIDGFAIDDYRDKINNKFVDPITEIINRRVQPYVYLSGGLYIVIIILLCVIIYILLHKKKC
jgi:hypothetical protein